MLEVLLEALLDSLKVFGIAFGIYFIFSFIHEKITILLQKHRNLSPVIGAGFGLIPECGISVIGADLYQKRKISLGTILAMFFACSDEALFVLCSDYTKIIYLLPLIGIKFSFACLLGFIIDKIYKENIETIEEEFQLDCCEHHHEKEKSKVERHLVHPLLHCIKIFAYVFIVNCLFGALVYLIGENQILNFLQSNKGVAPIFAGIIGLIPNCTASVLLSELFLMDGLSFGALVTGLSVNAGLGIIYLFRLKETRKKAVLTILILYFYSLGIGYCILGIMELIG